MDCEVLYEVKSPKNITEMTAVELQERLEDTDMIVFSFGAIENHGKHLPLGCDTFQGNILVKRVAEKLSEKGIPAVPGFAIPFGVQTNQFERTENYGNCYITQSTLIAMTKDLVLSLTKSGFKKFVLCVSHAENLACMQVVAKDLADDYNVTCIVVNWIPPMNDEWPKILKNADHQGHGGEDETSCTMAAVPKLVNLDNLPGWYPPESEKKIKMDGLEYYGGAVGIYAPLGTPQCPGYVGNPADATAETGEKCFDLYAEWISQVVSKYLS